MLVYLLIINLFGFVLAWADKQLAIHQKRRISEKSLFFVAFLGGAALMYISMCIFRHKTRHKRFMLGLPLITLLQIFGYFYFILTR